MSVIPFNPAELEAWIERERRDETLAGEAHRLAHDLRGFVRASWHTIVPNVPYVHGWHIDSICDHLQAVSDGEIRRLQIWVPPGTSKSTTVSITWPVWEWLQRPELRYLTASYDLRLATRFAVKSRDLIRSSWFRARWPEILLKPDEDLKQSYANTEGGRRFATSPSGGATGEHADRILIDDPLDANDVVSEAALEQVREWHDGTISTRFADAKTGAEVIIQQRLAERDLPGHVIAGHDDWTVLCLPERYERTHPFVYPERVRLPSGKTMQGDIRTEDGELLCPNRIGEAENETRAQALGSFRAAGQLQQRPAAREGAILKRLYWRWYPKQARDETDEQFYARLPRFEEIVQSWDTSLKDSSQSDKVAGTFWGKIGADLYLLGGRHDRMNLSATKQAIRDASGWTHTWWPDLPERILVEKQSNGVEVIAELRREVRGIIATNPSVGADRPSVAKIIRAEAASPTLEAGNIFLPGLAAPDSPAGYDPSTPDLSQQLVEQCAAFPLGDHDDLVDSFTQAVNWTRGSSVAKVSMGRPGRGRLVEAGHLPALAGLATGRSFGR